MGYRSPNGSLYAASTTFTGGVGGWGGSSFDSPGGDGGHGGDGISLVTSFSFNSPPASSRATTWNCAFVPGTGGPAGCCNVDYYGNPAGVSNGQDGDPIYVHHGATSVSLPGLARSWSAPTLQREGTSAAFDFTGEPGDTVWVASAKDWSLRETMAWNGILHLYLPGLSPALVLDLTPLGTLDATGNLTVTHDEPLLPGSIQHETVRSQAFFRDVNGNMHAGTPRMRVVIDAAF